MTDFVSENNDPSFAVFENQALKSERFREIRKKDWAELEALLNRMDKKGIRSLSW